jgi:hypothetical protein
MEDQPSFDLLFAAARLFKRTTSADDAAPSLRTSDKARDTRVTHGTEDCSLVFGHRAHSPLADQNGVTIGRVVWSRFRADTSD